MYMLTAQRDERMCMCVFVYFLVKMYSVYAYRDEWSAMLLCPTAFTIPFHGTLIPPPPFS